MDRLGERSRPFARWGHFVRTDPGLRLRFALDRATSVIRECAALSGAQPYPPSPAARAVSLLDTAEALSRYRADVVDVAAGFGDVRGLD